VREQCRILDIHRSTYYYEAKPESAENLILMRRVDELHLNHPNMGSRMLSDTLNLEGHKVNRKRLQRLMRLMGIEAIYPKKRLTVRNPEHEIYPYLLRGTEVTSKNQVWSTDITYIPVKTGFLYLVAVIDWFSRFVLSWRLSNSLNNDFCIVALCEAFELYGVPNIFNTDQGSQFTALNFIKELKTRGIAISMDGKGRALDNVYIERLWRTVKYEEVYLKDYYDGQYAYKNLSQFFQHYNYRRPHSELNKKPPSYTYLE
jgi:putative transposase